MNAPSDRPVAARSSLAFSRPLNVDDIPDEGLAVTITADPAECAAVAAEIDLPGVAMLSAVYRITRLLGGRVQVEGTLKARITQVCVVSLDPFDSEVSQSIAMTFAHVRAPSPHRKARPGNDRHALMRDVGGHTAPLPVAVADGEADPPDPIVDGRVDLGAVAVEFLTLALDFYPKKPGVHFSDVLVGDIDEPASSTFAALERLKDRS